LLVKHSIGTCPYLLPGEGFSYLLRAQIASTMPVLSFPVASESLRGAVVSRWSQEVACCAFLPYKIINAIVTKQTEASFSFLARLIMSVVFLRRAINYTCRLVSVSVFRASHEMKPMSEYRIVFADRSAAATPRYWPIRISRALMLA